MNHQNITMFLILLVIILTMPIKVLYTLGAITKWILRWNWTLQRQGSWFRSRTFVKGSERVSGTGLCVYVFIQQIWTIYFWLIWIHTMWLHHLNFSVSDGSLVRLGATLRARWLSKWSLGCHEICLFGSICTQTWLDGTTAVRQWDLSIKQPHPINSCCSKPTTFWT